MPRFLSARSRALGLAAAVLLTGGLAAVGDGSAGAVPADADGKGGSSSGAAGRVVEGQYIVVMKPRATVSAMRDARADAVRRGGEVLFNYTDALNGFAAKLPPAALDAVENNPNVAYVEADRTVAAFGDQYDPPWGLDRIDQRGRPLNRSYHYERTGSGVKAYIVDTGIRRTHTQFGARAIHGFTAVNDGNGSLDCNGHGSHVAGTVGSSKYGVAKAVTLVAVRVLDCNGSGTNSGVIAGLNFIIGNHAANTPAVANMSLGSSFDAAVNTAVANTIADGVSVVVAAGNSNLDACGFSPASAPGALTVGATTYTDARASYSNFGPCLDLFAPGSQVLSTHHLSDAALHIENGTSMASPHVAGVVATYLQANPTATPAVVANAVRNSATSNRVTGIGAGSPNKLLYSKFSSTVVSPPPPVTTNRVKQAGFESGPGIWQGNEWTINCDDGGQAPRTGRCNAYLGDYGASHTDMLGQRGIVLPSSPALTLRFWLRVATNEVGSTPFDKLHVRVISGGVTTTLATFSNANATAGYVVRSASLAAFTGQTIELRFVAVEDSSVPTAFFIDDVSIQ